MTETIKSRIEWLDFVRGISIICIIIGHSDNPSSFLHRIVFSFNVPIFFIVSGFLIAENKSFTMRFGEIVSKRFRSSILPYITTGLIYFVIIIAVFLYKVTLAYYHHNPALNFTDIINYLLVSGMHIFLNLCYGTGAVVEQIKTAIAPVGVLWFLPSFFCSSIIFYFTLKLTHKYTTGIKLIVIIILTAIGYIIGKYIFLPWSFDISLVSQLFMFSGYLMSKNQVYKNRTSILLIIVAICIWLFDLHMGGFSLNNRYYGNFAIASIAGAIAGCYLLMNISYLLSRNTSNLFYYRAISYIGKQSLVIFCFHSIDRILFKNNLFVGTIWIYNYWILFIVLRISYSLLIAETIKRVPILRSVYYPGSIHKSQR